MKYGYIRVSSISQATNASFDDQRNDLLKYGVDAKNIKEEIASASVMTRPVLQTLLQNTLQSGDELVVARFDRFSRKILDSLFTIHALSNKGVLFCHLDGPKVGKDWPSPHAILQTTMYSFLAESELENRATRTRIGIERAKQLKKYKGRVSKITPKLLAELKKLKGSSLSNTQICKVLEIGKTTLYLALKQLTDEKK